MEKIVEGVVEGVSGKWVEAAGRRRSRLNSRGTPV